MANIKAKYTRYVTGSPSIDRNLADVERSLNLLYDNPLQDGIIKRDILLGTSNFVVEHGLGREVRWIVIDKDADARIWRTGRDRNTLTLQASTAVTVSLYLF